MEPVPGIAQKTYSRGCAATGTADVTENDPIRLFVTHLYAPDESYFRVFEYLESQPNFFYKNFATPDKPPRSKEKEAIREDLRRFKQLIEAGEVPTTAGQPRG